MLLARAARWMGMPCAMGKTGVEDVCLENKKPAFGHTEFEMLAKRCQEALWDGKVRRLRVSPGPVVSLLGRYKAGSGWGAGIG